MCWTSVATAAPARDGFAPDLSTPAAAPRYAAVDSAAVARAETAMHNEKAAGANPAPSPLPFAVGAETPLEIADGRWDIDSGGARVWRMRIASPGATLLGVNFTRFRLPPSARLYFYDARGRVVQGPYTHADENPDGSLSIAVVPGAEGVLEVHVASAEREQVQIKLGMIYHGFRRLPGMRMDEGEAPSAEASASPGPASCEINVACPAGNDWRDPIRSGALIQIGNGSPIFLCSGQLVNNVRGDDTPYFLTANHCQIDATSTTPASSVVLYWNDQANTCSGSTGNLQQSQSGSQLLAHDAVSDFALIRLNRAPEDGFDVWYAGWDVSSTRAPASGVAIHQPQGGIKKISTYNDGANRIDGVTLELDNNQTQTIDAWRVHWSSGITEQGSSGSGLWNQDRHVVGVLSGGDTNEACDQAIPRGPDYFGRLDRAWTANSDASGQLKAWLDPDNTGAVCNDGRNPGSSATGCALDGSSGGSSGGGSGGSSGGGSSDGGGGSGGGSWPLVAWLAAAPLLWLRLRRRRTV